MKQIVLDTETTGLNAKLGDRIIELGCVEIQNRRATGNHFHRYPRQRLTTFAASGCGYSMPTIFRSRSSGCSFWSRRSV